MEKKKLWEAENKMRFLALETCTDSWKPTSTLSPKWWGVGGAEGHQVPLTWRELDDLQFKGPWKNLRNEEKLRKYQIVSYKNALKPNLRNMKVNSATCSCINELPVPVYEKLRNKAACLSLQLNLWVKQVGWIRSSKAAIGRDNVTKFSTSGFFMNQFPPSPRVYH